MVSLQISALRWGRVSHRRTYENPKKTATDKGAYRARNRSVLQNDAGTRVSDWHKFDTTETRFVLGQTNKKPGAAVTATGLNIVLEVAILRKETSTPGPIIQAHWGVAA